MAKFKTNSLISGIVWGVVLHVGINVILPHLKNLDISNLFGSAGATPEPAPTPPAEEEPMEQEPEDPEVPLEDEPMEGEEEEEEEYEEPMEGEEEYDEEDPTAAGARSPRGGGGFGSRRGGSGTIMAERARMRSLLARRYWR